MTNLFFYLLYAHIFFFFSSLLLTLIRGVMQLSGRHWRAVKPLKILPHLVDTLLIISGMALAALYVPLQLKLIIKIALLIVYIVCSAKFFGRKVQQPKPIFFIGAVLALVSAAGVALVF